MNFTKMTLLMFLGATISCSSPSDQQKKEANGVYEIDRTVALPIQAPVQEKSNGNGCTQC